MGAWKGRNKGQRGADLVGVIGSNTETEASASTPPQSPWGLTFVSSVNTHVDFIGNSAPPPATVSQNDESVVCVCVHYPLDLRKILNNSEPFVGPWD